MDGSLVCRGLVGEDDGSLVCGRSEWGLDGLFVVCGGTVGILVGILVTGLAVVGLEVIGFG